MAEKAVTSTVARKTARVAISSRSAAVQSALFGFPRFAGPSQAVDFAPPSNHWLLVSQRSSKTPARPAIVLRGVSFVPGDLNLFRVTNF